MNDFLLRFTLLLHVLIPFVLFMASIYLALHLLVARVVRRPDSPVLWFFTVVTGPLIRPVRALLPPNTSQARVLATALVVYLLAWFVSRFLLNWLG